jgi:hypothetical protein
MNLTSGQSAKKNHLSIGSRTECNRRTSMPNGLESFKWYAEKYPEDCCEKCLKKFNEKMNRLLQSKK